MPPSQSLSRFIHRRQIERLPHMVGVSSLEQIRPRPIEQPVVISSTHRIKAGTKPGDGWL